MNKKGFVAAGIAGVAVLGIIGSLTDTSTDEPTRAATTFAKTTEVAAVTTTEVPAPEITPETSIQMPDPDAAPVPPKLTESASQRNAVRKAESYLDFTAFSMTGLVEQLEYEGFSNEDAWYAVNGLDVDWREQAVKKAESYMSFTSFSESGLYDQLIYEGFTHEEAEYGASSQF
jgi:hypothetical protein